MMVDLPQLYAVKECADLFVDAALRNAEGDLMFLSAFGRDTALLQFFSAFTLPLTGGGLGGFTLTRDKESHRVNVGEPESLQKLTGRLPRDNLFGNLSHTWLYRECLLKPDRIGRRAVLLRYAEDEAAFATRVWLMVRELSPVPLLDHWREPLLAVLGDDIVQSLSTGKWPPVGDIDARVVALPDDFERIVSAAVARQALTLNRGQMPGDSAERLTAARLDVQRDSRRETPKPRSQRLFELGKVVYTPGIGELLSSGAVNLADLLRRHAAGDWGAVSDDGHANEAALQNGDRILSAYPVDDALPCEGFGDNTVWVITEWDRSVTTVLLPSEY